MSTLESDIRNFHEKFKLEYNGAPRQLPEDLQGFRSKFLQEELDEYNEAVAEGNLVKQADALTDLLYVAIGTMYLQGFPQQIIWNMVHAANMAKVRALREEDSKRGSTYDVVKPDGWQKPDPLIAEALGIPYNEAA